MVFRKQSWLVALLLVFAALSASSPKASAESAVISLNPQTTYQTIDGWEATAQCGQFGCPGFSSYSSSLFDHAVNDLGINRLRVEIKATSGSSTTFDLATFDNTMDLVVVPMLQRLMARGEKLFLNVCFANTSGFPSQPDMSAYAQQVLVTHQHLQRKYGFVPDAWEVALEPGNVSPNWTPPLIADAINRSDALLKANGFNSPYFIAPSSACGVTQALQAFNGIISSNGGKLPPGLKEFAYHRYCSPSISDLQSVANLRTQYGITTAQLEHGGATYNELHQDLKYANVSAWQQYTLAFCNQPDNGYQYYLVNGNTLSMGWQTRFLRQYFKFIRSGAVRIDAQTTDNRLDPVAFVNADGGDVVVVNASAAGSFSVQGLPAGTYGIKYTTNNQDDVDLPDVTISSGQTLNASIPDVGVITVYTQMFTVMLSVIK